MRVIVQEDCAALARRCAEMRDLFMENAAAIEQPELVGAANQVLW
jgi:hypothetical protein